MTEPPATADRRMPQLDGLRGLAVAVVCFGHWGPEQPGPSWLALAGVYVFFVISGFLITGILLDARAASPEGWRVALRSFYARRFLRIFPLYYAVLAAGCVLGIPEVRGLIAWHATYLTNVCIVLRDAWIDSASHFWTLAVEEQFYLVWPWVVLLLPTRWLKPLFVALIVLAPVSRGLLMWSGSDTAHVFTASCFDALSIGALMALLVRAPGGAWPTPRVARWAALTALAPWLVVRWTADPSLPRPPLAEPTLLAFLSGWLVLGAARGFRGPLGTLLAAAPLRYVGRISYGVYIFHNFARRGCEKIADWVGLGETWWTNIPLRFAMLGTLTLSLAALSWRFFEEPLNDLKRRFPYGAQLPRQRPET